MLSYFNMPCVSYKLLILIFFWLNTGIKRYALIMIINFSVINQRA